MESIFEWEWKDLMEFMNGAAPPPGAANQTPLISLIPFGLSAVGALRE